MRCCDERGGGGERLSEMATKCEYNKSTTIPHTHTHTDTLTFITHNARTHALLVYTASLYSTLLYSTLLCSERCVVKHKTNKKNKKKRAATSEINEKRYKAKWVKQQQTVQSYECTRDPLLLPHCHRLATATTTADAGSPTATNAAAYRYEIEISNSSSMVNDQFLRSLNVIDRFDAPCRLVNYMRNLLRFVSA